MAFFAVYDRIAPAQNKYMATLFNAAVGRKVVINRIYRYNWQVGAVVGVALEQYITLITSRTAGTNIPIKSEDSADVLTTGIAADAGSASVTEMTNGLVRRLFASSEEFVLATLSNNITGGAALLHDAALLYWRHPLSKGLVLRTGEGLTIRNVTNSTIGSVSYIIEFLDEPA